MPTTLLPDAGPRIREASFAPANRWTVESGREFVVIDDLNTLDPFFLSIAGAGNLWLFCSSDGALSAGRGSPETALFPYYTVDKIIDNWNCTGSWTALVCEDRFWNPFRRPIAPPSPTRRRLMKSALGDELVFDEIHEELGLRFTYRWQFSERYGFVRRAKLVNESPRERNVRLVDGLENFLPPGIDSRLQLQYSCLADAYKISELERGGSLLVHRLASGVTDEPVPLESMRATTVWTSGLGEGATYLVRRTAEEFLRGETPPAPDRIRARRGAMFLARERSLAPGESLEWLMVAEIEQTQAGVGELGGSLADPARLEAQVEKDIRAGRHRLREMVASADGFQHTADRDTALYHYHNTLSNIMRGGVPENGYGFMREQFLSYLAAHNRPLMETHATWLQELPQQLERGDLLARIESLGAPDLLRLAEEYLPLVLSRRHGDPSRPWNRFDIRLRDESGALLHRFEGNWRDIFQNWEALAWSHPEFLEAFISKFLNASTVDGFNPYRITSEGVDWEAPDEDDPWATIGYWGDHQIVYLLKMLDLEAKLHPDWLAARLDSPGFVFADVPYRLRSWDKILEDPRNTLDFDRERHEKLMGLKARLGGDGLLLRGGDEEPVRVTLAEKLLLPAAIKLVNLVPGGGVWMNTQKPEWNDANNALAGNGLSVVTACYLYRYVGLLDELISGHPGATLRISSAPAQLLATMTGLLADARWRNQEGLSPADRFELVEAAGRAAEAHRTEVYASGPGEPASIECSTVRRFLGNARRALEGVLHQNRRSDGLWHSYNVLDIGRGERTMEIGRLPVMLEGQVAVLSAEILEPAEALEVLEALPASSLWSERHRTYLLYPDREPPRFLETNRIEPEKARSIRTLAEMADCGETRLIVEDPECGFRFHPSLVNGYALSAVLDVLAGEPEQAEMIERDRAEIEALYEAVFNHRSFTGRSGSMFGYEGLGCVYWHMVSKLMLAAQEVTLRAVDSGAGDDLVHRLTAAYYSVQGGLGFRKSPHEYGAFPAEPYSHSPAHTGARQPGLTGQVKEGILCRLGELGVDFHDGGLRFRPRLLRGAEFDGLEAGPERPALSPGVISFTLAGMPVDYLRRDDVTEGSIVAHFSDGSRTKESGTALDRETTSEIVRRTGRVTRIVRRDSFPLARFLTRLHSVSSTNTKLSIREKVGYGLGDTASNLYFQFFNLFLFYYYTDVFGLNPASIGTMYLVANFWDAVNDPMMGAIADRVQTKKGKYRPFLLWCAIPYGLLGYAIFANPDLGETGKLAFAYTTFIAFKMIYTAINVPYSAMMGVISPKADDRMALSTYRFIGAFGGGFIVSLLVRPLVKLFGGDDEVLGFQITMALFGLLSVLMFFTTYATTRERVPQQSGPGVSVGKDLKLLCRNVPWLVMIGAAVCTLANVAVRGAVTVHYFKYYVGDNNEPIFSIGREGSPFFLDFDKTTIFMSSGMIAFIVGVAFTGMIGRALGKRNALVLLTLANAATVLGFFFIPPEATMTMFLVNLLGNLLAGPTPALVWALYTDVADYGEWKYGRRATGLVFSAAMFAQKMGLTIGGAAAGWMLGAYGFVANQEQTPEALMGIRVLFCIIPGALATLNGLVLLFYPLSTARTEQMHRELKELRARDDEDAG